MNVRWDSQNFADVVYKQNRDTVVLVNGLQIVMRMQMLANLSLSIGSISEHFLGIVHLMNIDFGDGHIAYSPFLRLEFKQVKDTRCKDFV